MVPAFRLLCGDCHALCACLLCWLAARCLQCCLHPFAVWSSVYSVERGGTLLLCGWTFHLPANGVSLGLHPLSSELPVYWDLFLARHFFAVESTFSRIRDC